MLRGKDVVVNLGERRVVQCIDLDIGPGEIIGLVGPNGAGKSTLLKALAGLVEPTSGQITLTGRRLSDIRPDLRAKQISYFAQHHVVHWPLSVEALVRLGRFPHRGEADDAAMMDALIKAEVEHLRDRTVTELSGGELARVLLARALAVDAPYLLADEPIAGLDPYFQLQLMTLFRELADSGTGVLVVLHDLSLAARFCDRVMLINAGIVAAQGTPRQVLTEDLLRQVFRVEMTVNVDASPPLIVPKIRV